MTILTLSDIHGSDRYVEKCASRIEKADLVILSGDITNYGGPKEASAIIAAVRHYNETLVAVAGNCDNPELESYLDEEGLNLSGRNRIVAGLCVAGLGGSLPGPARTPHTYSEAELAALLARAEVGLSRPFILVSHQPARNSKTDRIFGGLHVGSSAVRSFIERTSPLVCFSGHIHESIGTDRIGETHLVNPGPFHDGRFVTATIGPNSEVAIELGRL